MTAMRMTGAHRRRTWLAVGVLVVLSGCSTVADFFGEDAVLDTGIEPTVLAFDGPTYMAMDGRSLLVRNGTDVQRLPGARAVHWLPDGKALAVVDPRRARRQVVDPATGPVGPAREFWEDPSRPAEQLNALWRLEMHEHVLRSYDLSLRLVDERTMPPTDNPDATASNELERNYFGAVPTIDGVTFVKWHDGSEWYEGGDYGLLRIDGSEQENVLINANIVGLYLSTDGTGLLGLRQSSGDPCGGCVVAQDIVEIDPVTGEIGSEYGVPDDYDRSGRVRAIDKVGDRVAVRFTEPVQRRGTFTYEQRGTWVYDGEWTMVDGSDRELTWWQGGDRIVARVDDTERRRGDGFDLFWVHGGEETPLPGELAARPLGGPVEGSVAGQLLPPE